MSDKNKKFGMSDIPYEFQMPEDKSNIKIKELTLDFRQLKGFYVHDVKDIKMLGSHIITSNIVIDNVTNERITNLFEVGKEKFKDKTVPQLLSEAGDLALLTVLALTRAHYLLSEGEDDERE